MLIEKDALTEKPVASVAETVALISFPLSEAGGVPLYSPFSVTLNQDGPSSTT